MLGAREDARERCLEVYTEEKIKEVQEQFGRKLNQGVNVNRKLLWKEGNNPNGGKVESCSRIKEEMGG